MAFALMLMTIWVVPSVRLRQHAAMGGSMNCGKKRQIHDRDLGVQQVVQSPWQKAARAVAGRSRT